MRGGLPFSAALPAAICGQAGRRIAILPSAGSAIRILSIRTDHKAENMQAPQIWSGKLPGYGRRRKREQINLLLSVLEVSRCCSWIPN